MPTYEYECKSCSHTFEIFQAMSDPPLKDCPKCGKEVRRLIYGGAGIIFKGPGFYATDKAAGSIAKKDAKPDSNEKPACAGCPASESKQCPAAPATAGSDAKTA